MKEMSQREYIELLLNKNVDFHNRINGAIEQILRGYDGKETTTKLVESIKYVAEDILRIINR